MRRSTRIFKKYIATFLIVLMSINSFGAVVSDNDGSAFITKAEFDSLKNNFQAQIDQYNTSIDSKIDGAIANYLAGVKMEKKNEIDPYVSNYDEIRWMHGPYMYKSTRTFPNVTESSYGTYVDSVDWNFIEMENRRQSGGDQFFWFFDIIAARTGSIQLTMRLNRLGICPKEWGQGNDSIDPEDGGGWNQQNAPTRRGPTLFLQCKNENDKWIIEKDAKPIAAEIGLLDEIHILPHHGTKYGNYPDTASDPESIYGIDPRQITLQKPLTDMQEHLHLKKLNGTNADLLFYVIPDLVRVVNITPTVATGSIALASRVTLANNPQAYQSCVTQELFITNNAGNSRYEHNTGCGLRWNATLPTNTRQYNYQNSAACNYHDVRWQTEKQFDYDNNNLIYSMWGTDVTGDMNVAPYPITQNDMTYIPLQKSPNSFTLSVEPFGVNVNSINPHSMHRTDANLPAEANSYTHWNRGYENDRTTGNIYYEDLSLTIPLFYRCNWANLFSRAFTNRDTRAPLGKGEGLPIIIDSTEAGTLTVKFKYEEKADTDTSLVTLTPDHKIKTYFKDKKFTDASGNYLSGRTSTAENAQVVSLNGNEWTGKEVTVIIEVRKGDSVWMRIDPLTSDGVYCKMSDYKCELVTDV